ncbi:MAG: RNA methyltransferase [Planctomycetota bacterium]
MAKKPLLGNHQRCWIWGRNVVLATLRAGKWRPYEVRATAETAGEVAEVCGRGDIPVGQVTAGELMKLCGSSAHQGLAAKMPPFPYAGVADIPDGLVVATDGVQDAHNLGAIVRSAEAFGAAGVVIPEAGQAGVTSQVVRSSAGAVNGVPIARVASLTAFLKDCREAGRAVLGASERGAASIDAVELRTPAVLVIGNEGSGLSDEIIDLCDKCVAVPIVGMVGSLNAAVAAGILIRELTNKAQNHSRPPGGEGEGTGD